MKLLRRAATTVASVIPRVDLVEHFCKRYLDKCNGENDDNITTNGEMMFLKTIVSQCHTIFDIGANRGDWTALVLRLNPSANVHCFEPSNETMEKLLQRRFPSNVICNNTGMGAQKEERELFVFESGSGLNSLYQRVGLDEFGLKPPSKRETVKIDTFDGYCRSRGISRVDFAKVDVEGNELQVFRGMSSALANKQLRIIQFEYGGCYIDAGSRLKDICELMHDKGYTLHQLFPTGLKLISSYQQKYENYHYKNYAYIKDGDSILSLLTII